MRLFKIPGRVVDLKDKDIPVINRILDYLNSYFAERIQAQTVTYTTNMNTDVGGEAGDIVWCSTDDKFYGCSKSGASGSATWATFN